MKTLIIALVFAMSFTGFAQESSKMTKAEREKMTPEQRQEKKLAYLTKQLTLDSKQQVEVKQILAEKGAKTQEMQAKKQARKVSKDKMTPEEKANLKTQMQTQKADIDTKMKAVLSADQYTKWQNMRDDNKEKMKEKRKESKK